MRSRYIPFLLLCFIATSCTVGNLSYSEAVERNNRKLETEEERRDAEFMVEAADYNLLLKELAQQASEKAYARLVADFSTQNLRDHQVMGERLESLAKDMKFSLPANMSERHQDMLRDMEQANSRKIDRVYLNTIEIIHERLIRLYESTALNGNHAEIRSYAAAQLDIIRSHNRKARDIRQELL